MRRFVVLFCILAAAAAGPPVSKSRADIEKYKDALEKSREGMMFLSKTKRDIIIIIIPLYKTKALPAVCLYI
jgi:hypothetical protein